MPDSRFVITDWLDPIDWPSVALTNSPATATGYSAESIRSRDRHTVWKASSSAAYDAVFQYDLGQERSVRVLSICGEKHREWGSSLGPAVWLHYSEDGETWTNVSTTAIISQTAWGTTGNPVTPDLSYVFAASISAQFWQVSFYNTNNFSVGKMFLGPINDLGLVYSPGTVIQSVRQRTRHSVNGALAIHETGPAYRRWQLRFDKATATTQATLDSIHGLGRPFVYIDKGSKTWHVELDDDLLTRSHFYGNATTDLYDSSLNLVQLV